jgi:hypothetical protein
VLIVENYLRKCERREAPVKVRTRGLPVNFPTSVLILKRKAVLPPPQKTEGERVTRDSDSRCRCDSRACRLQSPNYPGVYPRNVTCYYRVEQKRAPPGHRALLAVSQRNSHKIHIKDQVNKYDTSQRTLRSVIEALLCSWLLLLPPRSLPLANPRHVRATLARSHRLGHSAVRKSVAVDNAEGNRPIKIILST